MERAVELLSAIHFLVIGLSHMTQPRAWTEFFVLLRSKGTPGAFLNGFLSLTMGSLIVAFHNVWTGIPLVLTVIGWGQVLKGLLVFVVPGYGVRSLARVSPERDREFVAAGVVLVSAGVLLLYSLYVSPSR